MISCEDSRTAPSRSARIAAWLLTSFWLVTSSASGAEPPTLQPELFAPGVVSKPDRHEYGLAISADGSEVFFGVDVGDRSEIWRVVKDGDGWGRDQPFLQAPDVSYNDPALDPTERRLYFIRKPVSSDSAADPEPDSDIWYLQRRGGGWSKPIDARGVINSSDNEYYVSFTDDGSLYFASNRGAEREGDYDLYVSHNALREPEPPVRLGPGVNTRAYEADVFVAPDGSYVIFAAGRRANLGRGDLYISFRGEDGEFEQARNLGMPINTEGHELCPVVSRDGRFFYYTSRQDIYRISAEILWKSH